MERNDYGRWPNLYVSPESNRYDYQWFSAEESPQGALLARQIQAQSYLNNNFVQSEGLVTGIDANGNHVQLLASDIATPSDVVNGGHRMEYIIGIEKGSTDMSPMTGKLVTWKKRYAPLDELPTYDYCKDGLLPGWEEFLREMDSSPLSQLTEPEALGKTINAGKGVVKEFMRHEIQRSIGKGEVWFMGLVERTVFQMFVRNWGPFAVKQIGEAKQLQHSHINPDVKLVPTVMDIDTFYTSYYHYLKTLKSDNKLTEKRLANFVYMSEGLSDEVLGEVVANFRAMAMSATQHEGLGV